jgi:hypothetical protein
MREIPIDVQSFRQDIERVIGDKAALTIDDVINMLGCTRICVLNWMRRNEPHLRPPKLKVGRQVFFPRTQFIEWLMKEQGLV